MTIGTLFIVSAPSGAGKTSLLKALVETEERVRVSVSHTTRPRRPGEREGVDYHFIDSGTFSRMIEAGAFLEHARVFGNFYGTSEAGIREQLARGSDVILEIDWQGARQVRALYPGCVGIFILPPSMEELERRLRARAQDTEAVIRRRLANAREELEHRHEFQYAIINNDFDEARRALADIIRKERNA